ncbi:MAG: thymidine kinase [Deltaproteobacteria bacterium]|nr:thymidine kinase [Deltaproteobacteria bacterium]
MYARYTVGQIEVICGSMFSGKTEELIRRLRRANIARQRVQVFKPGIDDRYGKEHVTSHTQDRVDAQVVGSSAELLRLVDDRTEVVGVDEVQFFDSGIVEVVDKLANQGKRVIVAGLDQDYLGRPFEPMPQIMAIAEHVTKTLAVCVRCGAPANRSQRLLGGDNRVLVGAQDTYEPRCRRCFEPELARQLDMNLGASPGGARREAPPTGAPHPEPAG